MPIPGFSDFESCRVYFVGEGYSDTVARRICGKLEQQAKPRRRDASDRDSTVRPALAAERRYMRLMTTYAAKLRTEVLDALEAVPDRFRGDQRLDNRASAHLAVIANLRRKLVRANLDPERLQQLGFDIDRQATGEVERIIGTVPRIPGNLYEAERIGMIQPWVQDQLALASTIPAEYLDTVQEAIIEGVKQGRLKRDILRSIAEKLEADGHEPPDRKLRDRLGVIVQHQVGLLQSHITRERYRQAGGEAYKWVNMRDQVVRPNHVLAAEQEGDTGAPGRYKLNGPGAVGLGVFGQDIHPGEDVNCRCRARIYQPDDEVLGERIRTANENPSGFRAQAYQRRVQEIVHGKVTYTQERARTAADPDDQGPVIVQQRGATPGNRVIPGP